MTARPAAAVGPFRQISFMTMTALAPTKIAGAHG
jgi:hypothetical protein